jgi:hypothetical protein
LQKPSVLQLALPASWQVACGSAWPLATLVQDPRELERPQDWQAPWQAVAQQVCCAQKPLPHSAAVAQVWPLLLRPQEPALQTAGEAQSASEAQEFLQTLTPHWNGKQGPGAGVTQVPAPSQVEAAVNTVVPTGQLEPMQVVPCRYFWQAPLPSHFPSVPQEVAPWSLHIPAGSTALTGTLVQVPSALLSAQDWQAPPQAALQQIPCAQKPLPHSAGAEQEAPLVLRPHEFRRQLFGDLH